jgi:hypothetical protein
MFTEYKKCLLNIRSNVYAYLLSMSEAYAYVLFDIVNVDVYLVENNLVYTVPKSHWKCVLCSGVFRIILFPI